MKNLYQNLGLDPAEQDPQRITAALQASPLSSSQRRERAFILLEPTRKAHYDWTLKIAQELHQCRTILGLENDPQFSYEYREVEFQPLMRWKRHLGLWKALILFLMTAGAWKVYQTWPGNEGLSSPILPSSNIEPTTPIPETTQPRPAVLPTPLPRPNHGLIEADSTLEPRVPWHIETAPGQDFFLTLRDARTHRQVITLYLHGGEPFSGRIPEGEYELVYTFGTQWHGPQQTFGLGSRTIKEERPYHILAGPDDSWTWELNIQPSSADVSPVAPVGPNFSFAP